MRADVILQLCDFLGVELYLSVPSPRSRLSNSVSISWIGHRLGHGAQAAFLGERKTKAKARPANKQGTAGWFHPVSQFLPIVNSATRNTGAHMSVCVPAFNAIVRTPQDAAQKVSKETS